MIDAMLKLFFVSLAAVCASVAATVPAVVHIADGTPAFPLRGCFAAFAVFILGALIIDRD